MPKDIKTPGKSPSTDHVDHETVSASELDASAHPTLDALRAWEMWETLTDVEQLEVVLASANPADLVTDESLEVLARFYDDAIAWLRIKVRAREIGLIPYDLERAVKQLVGHQRPRPATPASNGVPPPAKAIPTVAQSPVSIEDFFDYTITSPKTQTFIPRNLAEYLMQLQHYRYVANQLWVYRGGAYRSDGEAMLREEIQGMLGKERLERRLTEVVKYVEVGTRLEG
jgi:hypothetical protein